MDYVEQSGHIGDYGRGQQAKVHDGYAVIVTVCPGGERLPVLVHGDTGVPCELALRYVIRRRDHVAVSTLLADCYAIKRVYEWCDCVAKQTLDGLLKSGRPLTYAQYASLASYVKAGGYHALVGRVGRVCRDAKKRAKDALSPVLSAPSFNHTWSKIGGFVAWCAASYAQNYDGMGGRQEGMDQARERVQRAFDDFFVGEEASPHIRVYTSQEIAVVERAMDLARTDVWPDTATRVRNVAMSYLDFATGLRLGELLTLTLDCLPEGPEEHIRVRRVPDDPLDPRANAPQVKTNERELYIAPGMRELLMLYVDVYRPRSVTPFVFLAQGGRPMSLRAASGIMERVGAVGGIRATWHRIRHTVLDEIYDGLADEPDGIARFMEISGHNAIKSIEPYVRNARRRRANQFLRGYQYRLNRTFPMPPSLHMGLLEIGDTTEVPF